ncbi:A24 family peptidase [Lysinibacter sp. HNR]|uniref:prepilin peptidase n=1 Tax=Lysinibacter sp. HNR TaxID=3031408 RepID=UPI002435296A|nr:A24 family peptidase [Lysinibacter sp. HNR]WGD36845.1 A24 family peptidase [Lysinibacter sp. HNR]
MGSLVIWVLFGYLACVTIPLAYSDVRERRLPNSYVLPGFVIVFWAIAVCWIHDSAPPIASLLGGLVVVLIFYCGAALGGFGMGDVKLATLIVMSLGLLSWWAAFVAITLAGAVGGVAGYTVLWRSAGRREAATGGAALRARGVPFGVPLLIGLWGAAVLWGVVFLWGAE